MKLFNRKAGNKVININGTNVKFVNCVAEVEDEFGKEILKLGFPNLYEHGKQPVFETPKEVQMKSEFNDREEWYKKEIARLTNISTSQKRRIEELEQEVVNWKGEYEREHEARLKFVEGVTPTFETVTTPLAPENSEEGSEGKNLTSEEEKEVLCKELLEMKKDELIAFGTESGFDMSAIAEKTKAEIVEFLVTSSKE